MDSNNNIIDFLKAKFLGEQTFSELLELSRDHNGYKREDAVRRLGMLGDPAALPDLIERANDWVPQVRKAGYDAILNLRKPGNALAFIAALPALVHLEKCSRDDHSGLVANVQDYLCNDGNRELLILQMTAANARVASMVCKLVMQKQLLGTEEMVSRCLSHPDVVVRSMATDSLRILDAHAFDALIASALSDGFMPVRREAFQQLLARDRVRGLEVARKFLFDGHSAIRAIAVANLVRDGHDVVSIYDAAHANAKGVKPRACILWAWAALNCVPRTGDIRRYLSSQSSTLRRSALQALTKLIATDAEPDLIAGLRDAARSVCIESSRLIVKLRIALSADQLISVAQTAKTPHAIIACTGIAAKTNKWDWLQVVLHLYKDESSEEIQNLLNLQIRDWNIGFNNNAAQPSGRQIAALVASARLCADRIDKNQFPMLQFTLKSYGGVV